MKSPYTLSSLLSLILPAISFFLLLLTLGTGLGFTIFTANTLFVLVPAGSIILAIVIIRRKKELLTKTETVLVRLGIIIAAATIISFFWFQLISG